MEYEEVALSTLRRRLGTAQHEIGKRLGVRQSRVSRIEADLSTGTLQIHSLEKYVQALGGRLHILVQHDGRWYLIK